MKTMSLVFGIAVASLVLSVSNIADAATVAADLISQDKIQTSVSTSQELKLKQSQAQAQIDNKNAIAEIISVHKESDQVMQAALYDTVITKYNFNGAQLLGPDVFAINYAYERGGNGVVLGDKVSIDFTKKNGERLTKTELQSVIDALKTAPGTTGAQYWKDWESVRYVNGQYYWPQAQTGERTMTAVEVQLYSLWKKTPLAASLYDTVITKYNFNGAQLLAPDVFAINYAYERGGNGVVLGNKISINFTKKNGERLTKDELQNIINTFKTAPGTTGAQYWKKWSSVKAVDGKLYWASAPAGQRALNAIEVRLYSLWKKR